MRQELWHEVESALAAALEQPEAERRGWLERSCNNPEVRAEVEALLGVYSHAEGFLSHAPAVPGRLVGAHLGPYDVVELVGAGGMGEVYRAHDPRIGREVAIKVLPAPFAGDAERVRRFTLEVRAIGSLNHPNVMAIYDVGEHAGAPYLVCELLEGETLRTRLEREAIPLTKAIEYALAIAQGLSGAHAKGIVHRDLKPENVFLTQPGGLKILDFGLARLAQREGAVGPGRLPPTETAPGMILGTAGYMAPEQVRGEPCDHRSDIFSLGAVLYEMLSGKKAFSADTQVEVMTAVLKVNPPELNAPPPLRRILRRCLEKDPAARFQSADDLAFSLSAIAGADFAHDLESMHSLQGTHAGKRAVAVLPFQLLPRTPEDEYLSVALADSLINQLSSSDELLVRPVAAVVKYGSEGDPVAAALGLNAQVVVKGSIQKVGERLRVYIQAWDSSKAATVLSGKYDAEMADLFGLQDRIADELAQALDAKARIPGSRAAARSNPLANELFLRGVERLSRWNRWDTPAAIDMLEEATRLDATFVDAWARLAEGYRQMAVVFTPSQHWIRKADLAVRRALALDRNNAEAQCIRGRLLWTHAKGFQNRAALKALQHALEISPGCHVARVEYGCILFHIGLHDEAQERLRGAMAASPNDTTALAFLGLAALYKGEYEEAERYSVRGLSINPTNFWTALFGSTVPLYRHQLDEAETRIKATRQLLPNEPMLSGLEALLWARRGESRKAGQALKQALRTGKSTVHAHHTWHAAAAAYAVLGQPDKALPWLRKASNAGLPNYPLFRDDPHFESLRRHPQFLRLLADTKRQWQSFKREFGSTAV